MDGTISFPSESLCQMGVEAGLNLEKKTVEVYRLFRDSSTCNGSGAYPEPNVICSHPWWVSFPGVIIVFLFKFPCVTLIECLNFICVVVFISHCTLSVTDCVCGFCVSCVRYTLSIGKNYFRQILLLFSEKWNNAGLIIILNYDSVEFWLTYGEGWLFIIFWSHVICEIKVLLYLSQLISLWIYRTALIQCQWTVLGRRRLVC